MINTVTIYDVLRELVAGRQWPSEGDMRERMAAIDSAEHNQIFGTEGRFELNHE
jgi:hypothetical protein